MKLECNSCTREPLKKCPNGYCKIHCSETPEHFNITKYRESDGK